MILCLLAVLRPVDDTPYFLADSFQETIARLDSLSQNLNVHSGRIEVGMAKASLLPQTSSLTRKGAATQQAGVPLAGYGDRQSAPATNVHDSLFAKAIAVRVGGRTNVLVSLEALIVPVEIADAVAARANDLLGLERGDILFSATHTHSGIGAWGEGWLAEQFAGGYNPAIRAWLVEQTVLSISSAVADLQPGKFGHASFHAPAYVKNRLVGELGRVNDIFDLAIFRQSDGDLAVLGSYAAHATVLSAQNMAFSGDYPGYWYRAIERQVPGMAVFFAGSVGSHGPVTANRDFEEARQLGEALADSVLAHLPYVEMHDSIFTATLTLPVTLPELQVRATSSIRVHPVLAGQMMRPGRIFLQAFRFGDLLWLSTPCDFSGELALDLKNAANVQGRQLLISSFNGGYIGYLVPGKYYHYRSYESRIMSWFGPAMGDYFMHLSRRMLAVVTR